MERGSVEMDWVILPELCDFSDEDRKVDFNLECIDFKYFDRISIKNSTENEFKDYPDEESVKEISEVTILHPMVIEELKAPPKILFMKPKESEFDNMRLDSPKSVALIKPSLELIQFDENNEDCEGEDAKIEGAKVVLEEEKGRDCLEGFGFSIWRWRINGIGGLSSIGVVAATLCIFVFGGKQRHNQQKQQKIQFKIYPDNKRIKHGVVHHTTRLNQALSSRWGVPLTGAHITFGGYYD
ncbi:hypothetical protein QJS10_CPB19g00821 [Acorus calamus]|uniref:DUF6821 domain-containing protein n=1 Tax=Acorus calamus TaxID=4465 RepID=A0AAV9CG99_ACOCL|nr:hypothetical protein QJS10_CPB19g00821 [Acorus calamus]